MKQEGDHFDRLREDIKNFQREKYGWMNFYDTINRIWTKIKLFNTKNGELQIWYCTATYWTKKEWYSSEKARRGTLKRGLDGERRC